MASESSVTDRTVHLLAEEKKVGDDTKEEEKHDPEGVSVALETTKEEKIEQVGENNNSLHECQVSSSLESAVDTNEGKSNDVIEISTSKAPVNLEFEKEILKDDEVGLASDNESKPEESPLVSSVQAETQEAPNPESSMDIADVELIKSEDSKGEVQKIVQAEFPTTFVLDTFEAPKVDTSTLTSINVPVKDLEVESGSPEEQKPKVSAETKVESELFKSEDAMDEVQVLVPAQIPADTSENPERIDVDSITPINIEVPVKDLEIDSGSPEEKKPKESAETKEHTELIKSEDSKKEVHEFVPAKLPIISSEAPEKSYVDSIQLTTIEVPVKGLEVDSGSLKEQNLEESAETKVGIKSGDSKDEGQELVPTEILTLTSEAPEKNDIDSSAPSSTDVPAKDIEVESGFPQLRKQEESAKTKEPISDVNTNDGGGEVAGSTSYEGKSSGVAEVVKKKDEDFKEEEIQTIIKSPMVLKATSEEAQTLYDEDKPSKEVAVKKDDGITRDGTEISTVLDVSSDAKVSSEDEKASKPGEVDKERKDETSNGDSIGTVPKVSEVSLAEGNVLVEDKSVVNENVEAIERGLAETTIHPTVPEVCTEQVIAPENVEEPLNLTAKELNVSPEASDILSKGEKVSAGDEMKNETLKVKGVTFVETPKDITISDQSLDQLIEEKKIESSRSDIDASIKPSLEAVKDVISSEKYKEKKSETSEDLSFMERDLDAADVSKEDVKAEGAIENATDDPVFEELGGDKKENEIPKDQEPIVSSDTRDAKLIKEVTKRESNIFAKVKRSIIKAKKAILGKSPGPKTVASEAKDENP